MATIEHKDIPNANLHETKGVSTATTGAVLTANAGVGLWQIPSYGELYISGGAGVVALPAASAFTRVDTAGTIWTVGVNKDMTLNAATGEFTIITAGTYNVAMWIVFTTAALGAGTTYNFRYAIGGVTSTRTISTSKHTAGVDTMDTAASGLATFAANDVVSLYVGGDATSSGTNITVVEAGFTLHRV